MTLKFSIGQENAIRMQMHSQDHHACTQCGRESHTKEYPEEDVIGTVSEPQKFLLVEKSRDELQLLQLQDPSVGFIMKVKDKNEKPSSSQIKGMSMTVYISTGSALGHTQSARWIAVETL